MTLPESLPVRCVTLLASGTLNGNVQIQDNDITACASEAGQKGSYGFTLTCDGDFTTWNGNCSEPG